MKHTKVVKIVQFKNGVCVSLSLQTCPGKCGELTPCVQCRKFKSGPFYEEKDDLGRDLCEVSCPFEVWPQCHEGKERDRLHS